MDVFSATVFRYHRIQPRFGVNAPETMRVQPTPTRAVTLWQSRERSPSASTDDDFYLALFDQDDSGEGDIALGSSSETIQQIRREVHPELHTRYNPYRRAREQSPPRLPALSFAPTQGRLTPYPWQNDETDSPPETDIAEEPPSAFSIRGLREAFLPNPRARSSRSVSPRTREEASPFLYNRPSTGLSDDGSENSQASLSNLANRERRRLHNSRSRPVSPGSASDEDFPFRDAPQVRRRASTLEDPWGPPGEHYDANGDLIDRHPPRARSPFRERVGR